MFGKLWLGVFARDNLPAPTDGVAVVNTDSISGRGEHWVAMLDVAGRRYFHDPLGRHGRQQRQQLVALQPGAVWSEDDPEQKKSQDDCGVRALVALCIGARCGIEEFLAL